MTRRAFSVAVYAVHGRRVLLVRHARLGLRLPVGGEVEPGETPLEAARRELAEETGLEGDFDVPTPWAVDGSPPGLLAYEEHPAGAKGLHLNFNFVARTASDTVRSDGSFDDARWLDAEAVAKEPMPDNVRECARRALDCAR